MDSVMKIPVLLAFLSVVFFSFGQNVTFDFVAKDTTEQYVPLQYIVVENVTKGWRDTLLWPETTIVLEDHTGLQDHASNGGLSLSQNVPNPFYSTTAVNMSLPEDGSVIAELTDINGKSLAVRKFDGMHAGLHALRISVSKDGVYLLKVVQDGLCSTVKMVGRGGARNNIEYFGCLNQNAKSGGNNSGGNNSKDGIHQFEIGDMMTFTGYAQINGQICTSMVVSQQALSSQVITLYFPAVMGGAAAVSCPNEPIVIDIDGNIYNTVLIGQQCWMKENLRVTRYSDGTFIPTGGLDDTIAHRYFPNNNSSIVATYGYIYNWAAATGVGSYGDSVPDHVQGICPSGWHLPDDSEWYGLVDFLKTQDEYWCDSNSNNVAKSLASTIGWAQSIGNCNVGTNPSANNATGFSAFPAGRMYYTLYQSFTGNASFWSATEDINDSAHFFTLGYTSPSVTKYNAHKSEGNSVRCLRD